MRPSDHLLSEMDRLANRAADEAVGSARTLFLRASCPVLGEAASEEIFSYWKERHAATAKPDFPRLGSLAAFIAGEYDETCPALDHEDFEALRETVSAEADNLPLDLLSRLMSDLVSRGALR